MLRTGGVSVAGALVLAVALAGTPQAHAKIVCWKDKSGKVVGCGDTIPPEYRENAAKELDKRGMTRRTIESADEAAKHRARDQAQAKQKQEELREAEEQKRVDAALLATYASAQEIDQRRDRELQQVDIAITQLKAPLKNTTARYDEAVKRKAKQQEIDRIAAEKAKIEQDIAAREKEKVDIVRRYAEQKKRYGELKGGRSVSAVPTSVPAKPR